ncbi:Cilia and flagella associated protein 61 [Desmophyllum pertusum]|uniref:Cilia and flagella associated protein 61 n=1 Tax=Desmophyllum pertusum TaxID=174260 RepID=A0A9W9ZCK3_9CNID|nr:Cilia and flagella associated protein 61 [Desmophyllum pertusum]
MAYKKLRGLTPVPRVASPEKLPSLTPSEEQVARSTPLVEQVPRSTPSVEQVARSTPLEEQEEMPKDSQSQDQSRRRSEDKNNLSGRKCILHPAVYRFFTSCFDLFPEKDYCILTMPHLVPEFPLLQSFVRVTPRKYSTLSQELYVFHRWGLIESFHVRPCTSADKEGIQSVVSQLDGADIITRDVQQYNTDRRDPDGTEVQCFSSSEYGSSCRHCPCSDEKRAIEYLQFAFQH